MPAVFNVTLDGWVPAEVSVLQLVILRESVANSYSYLIDYILLFILQQILEAMYFRF